MCLLKANLGQRLCTFWEQMRGDEMRKSQQQNLIQPPICSCSSSSNGEESCQLSSPLGLRGGLVLSGFWSVAMEF